MGSRVAQVAIKKMGGFRLVSRKEFLSLSSGEKKDLILHKKIEFIDHTGKNIPFMDGVKDVLEN